jgi:hypothetical protein
MVLLSAVAVGLAAGLLRAGTAKRRLAEPALLSTWLVAVAFLPQWFAFFGPASRFRLPESAIPVALITSQVLLLAFVWINRTQPGFWALGVGLALNLAVIALNGGWMPISLETLARMYPNRAAGAWIEGQRLGTTKDMIMAVSDMRLAWLSDRFILPSWFPYQVAFSLGDIFIATGAFLLLWSLGGLPNTQSLRTNYEHSNPG